MPLHIHGQGVVSQRTHLEHVSVLIVVRSCNAFEFHTCASDSSRRGSWAFHTWRRSVQSAESWRRSIGSSDAGRRSVRASLRLVCILKICEHSEGLAGIHHAPCAHHAVLRQFLVLEQIFSWDGLPQQIDCHMAADLCVLPCHSPDLIHRSLHAAENTVGTLLPCS